MLDKVSLHFLFDLKIPVCSRWGVYQYIPISSLNILLIIYHRLFMY